MALPIAFDSARLVPGRVTALITRAPSLNAGRKGSSHERRGGQCPGEHETGGADHHPGVAQRYREQPLIASFQGRRECRLASLEDAWRAREQVRAERRRDGQGNDQRRQERDEICEAERLKQPTFHPGQEEKRQEDEHDDQRGEDDGSSDLTARLIDDLHRRAALLCGPTDVLAEPSGHVLDVDDGVVDERSDGDSHAAEGHTVDRQAGEAQTDDSRQKRQRYGEQRDGAGP